jgi:hypothetical protein
MLLRSWTLAVALAASIAVTAQSATIVNYDLTGVTTASPPATYAATSVAGGVSGELLARGAGILPAGLANGFSSNDWTLTSSEAIAISNNDYYQFGFDLDATHTASVSSFDTNLRRSAVNAPDHFLLYMSPDGFSSPPTVGSAIDSWTYFGRSSGTAPATVTPGQWMTTDTAGQDGNPITTRDLSGVAALQNIPAGSNVTFRLYAWGANAGSAQTNTVALARNQGPLISGTISSIVPEPSGILLCLSLIGMGVGLRQR